MIDYKQIERLTNQGIDAFAGDPQASFEMIVSGGGKVMVGGVETDVPEVRVNIHGAIRAISYRYIDGDNIKLGDKRGFFSNVTPIENGMIVILNGEHWRVIDNRPVDPTQSFVIAYRPILRKVATNV